jgi:hypothetical protein
MKYFKVTNKDTEETYCVYSPLPNETPTHVAMSEHLDLRYRWQVEEVTAREFHKQQRHKCDQDLYEEEVDTDDEYFWD